MGLSIHQSRKLETAGVITLSGVIMALLYVVLADGFGSIFPYINATLCALLVALLVSFLELGVFAGSIRRWKFSKLLLLRTLLYAFCIPFIIFSVLLIARTFRYGISLTEVVYSEEFRHYLFHKDFNIVIAYTLALAFVVSFTYQMSRKMGQGVLWSTITGKYHHALELERIFLFMHIRGSARIIRNIGLLKYHRLLNDLAYDISPSLLVYKGVIYQYVEDELVVSWNYRQGLYNANCLRAFFDAREQIRMRREKYFQLYGFVPQFRAAFHCGKVIRGEVGDIKSELAFYGDVMNTTSRILGQADQLEKSVLVSAQLMEKLQLPPLYGAESCGKVLLKGKEEATELWCVEEAELPNLSE